MTGKITFKCPTCGRNYTLENFEFNPLYKYNRVGITMDILPKAPAKRKAYNCCITEAFNKINNYVDAFQDSLNDEDLIMLSNLHGMFPTFKQLHDNKIASQKKQGL